MYSQRRVERAQEALERKLGFPLLRHAFGKTEEMAFRLKDAYSEEGTLLRPLAAEEEEFISNELLLCKIDFRYWAERYCKISSAEGRLEALKLIPSQEKLLKKLGELEDARYPLPEGKMALVVPKARRVGATAFSQAAIAHAYLLRPQCFSLTASDIPENTLKLYQIQLRIYDNLPPWMRPSLDGKVKADHLHIPSLDSDLTFGTGNQKNPLGQGVRLDAIHITEASTWEPSSVSMLDDDVLPAFFSSQVWTSFWIVESTGKGGEGNWFHDTCQQALAGKSYFRLLFLSWYDRPDLLRLPAEGVEIPPDVVALGQRLEREQKISIAKEQLAWYSVTREHYTSKGKLDDFLSEFPSCLVSGSMVPTNRGLLPIEKVTTGMETPSGKVIDVTPQRVAPVFTLKTVDGRKLTGTGEHPIFTEDQGFVGIEHLRAGQRVKLVPGLWSNRLAKVSWRTGPVSHEVVVDEDLAEWAGAFLGDGCYSSRAIDFACDAKDIDVADRISELTEKLFQIKLNRRLAGKNEGCLELRAGCTWLGPNFLEPMGLIDGSSHRILHVPEWIFRSPKRVAAAFLRGLFECDGGASSGVVSFHTKSEQFAVDVQLLLLNFGITSRIRSGVKKLNTGFDYIGHTVQMSKKAESRLYYDEIGFVGARKKGYKALLYKKKIKSGRPEIPMEFWDVVESITAAGEAVTYNLTIENSHVFPANGILTHNTVDECFRHGLRSVFPYELREEMRNKAALPEHYVSIDPETGKGEQVDYPPEGVAGHLVIWEAPDTSYTYVVGVDASHGLGKDRHAVEVVRKGVGGKEDVQVAEYWADDISPFQLASIVDYVSRLYGDDYPALTIIETNPGSPGQITQQELIRRGFPSLYVNKKWGKVGHNKGNSYGFPTTPATRNVVTSCLEDAIKNEMVILHSPFLFREMDHYVETWTEAGRRHHGHAEGKDYHDDGLMALGLALLAAHENELGWLAEERRKTAAERKAEKEKPPPAPYHMRADLPTMGHIWDDFMERADRESQWN